MSPSKYVQQAVANCRGHLAANYNGRYKLKRKADNPFPTGYEPEVDVTAPLTPELASYYQSIIGIMRWMIEIGRIDIATEVSLLSSYLQRDTWTRRCTLCLTWDHTIILV
jgi:hypothetical protein